MYLTNVEQGGVGGVIFFLIGNRTGVPSSNSGQTCLHYIYNKYTWEKYASIYYPYHYCKIVG